jgi:hypothetical protein
MLFGGWAEVNAVAGFSATAASAPPPVEMTVYWWGWLSYGQGHKSAGGRAVGGQRGEQRVVIGGVRYMVWWLEEWVWLEEVRSSQGAV